MMMMMMDDDDDGDDDDDDIKLPWRRKNDGGEIASSHPKQNCICGRLHTRPGDQNCICICAFVNIYRMKLSTGQLKMV